MFGPAAGAELCEPVRSFLAAGDAPVVITVGTFQHHGGVVAAQAVQAARALGWRTIVLAAERRQLPLALADDLLWQPYVPLQR